MILGKKDTTVDALYFIKNFTEVLNCTLRIVVKGPTESVCTGWMLTNNIVILPDFAATQNDNYLCYPASKNDKLPVPAKLIFKLPSSVPGNVSPALLLVQKTINNPAPALQSEKPEEGDPIAILQYPGGVPNIQVSFGKIMAATDENITYDADTQPGSSGSPVLNLRTGKIIGMHYSSGPSSSNTGLSIAAIITFLRNSEYWSAISKYHTILDVIAPEKEMINISASPVWKNIHYSAARSWNFDSSLLSKSDQETLKSLVANADTPQWILKPADRQAILSTITRAELQKIKKLKIVNETGQKVIDRILKGGPYELDKINETELPYWLQAVRWFAEFDKELPDAAEVNRALEKKRIRSRLAELGGSDFKGRKKELADLNKWYKNSATGPVVISGIGGIGKSALICHFVLSLPESTTVLWLDFDRADLAPDDANSAIKILCEQVSVQLDMQIPAIVSNWKDWKIGAGQLGESLARQLKNRPVPILILDGFEVAQQVKQYEEIWKLLELLISKCPSIKIIISGRAPVNTVKLAGKEPVPVALKGMDEEDAASWLLAHNISKASITKQIIEISGGIPLVLKLAVHYIDTGGKMNELPKQLPNVMIEGYLYQRILDRVIDIQLKPISREALILRKISADIIKEILSSSIPAGSSPEDVLERLSREMSLVGENDSMTGLSAVLRGQEGVLQLRPEVRTATLKLLELENAAWVKTIDQKVVDYYLRQNLEETENRAELIYHLLRIGDIAQAEKYWDISCAPLLKYSIEDLADTAFAERKWLLEKTGQAIGKVKDDIRIWETNALKQVKDLLARGQVNKVNDILKQRTERSENSPLVVYDALVAGSSKDIPKAITLLSKNGVSSSAIQSEKLLLRALFEEQKGDWQMADYLLSQITPEFWRSRKKNKIEALTVQAARLRLAVSISNELAITALNKPGSKEIALMKKMLEIALATGDAILPSLTELINGYWRQESFGSYLKLPVNKNELREFTRSLQQKKHKIFPFDISPGNLQELFSNPVNKKEIESLSADMNTKKSGNGTIIAELALLASYRWKQASETLLLYDLTTPAIGKEGEIDPLDLSVIASLAAFRGQPMEVILDGYGGPSIDSFLNRVIKNNPKSAVPPLSEKRKHLLTDYISLELQNTSSKQSVPESLIIGIEKEIEKQSGTSYSYSSLRILSSIKNEASVSMLLYLFGPDPLEMLCRRVLGLPDNYKF